MRRSVDSRKSKVDSFGSRIRIRIRIWIRTFDFRLSTFDFFLRVLLLSLAACQGWGIDPDLERMIDQARHEPYEATSYFADQRVLRVPPAGTVPREQEFHIPPVDGFPPGIDGAAIRRGRKHFEITCAACHGVLGDGDSKVAENMSLRRPPSLHEERLRGRTPAQIYEIVTKGFGLMPALREQLPSVRERWEVVAYVKALQLSQGARLDELPPSVRQEAERQVGR
jgi:mono/diheme cytochrome c family protein